MDTAVPDVWEWCPRNQGGRWWAGVCRGGPQARPHARCERGDDCQRDKSQSGCRGGSQTRPQGGCWVAFAGAMACLARCPARNPTPNPLSSPRTRVSPITEMIHVHTAGTRQRAPTRGLGFLSRSIATIVHVQTTGGTCPSPTDRRAELRVGHQASADLSLNDTNTSRAPTTSTTMP